MKENRRREVTERKYAKRRKYHEYAGPSRYVCLETPKRCSCWMCNNPRKRGKGDDKLTLQERKSDQALIRC